MTGASAIRERPDNRSLGIAFKLFQAVSGPDARRTVPHHVGMPKTLQALAGLILPIVLVEAAKDHLLYQGE